MFTCICADGSEAHDPPTPKEILCRECGEPIYDLTDAERADPLHHYHGNEDNSCLIEVRKMLHKARAERDASYDRNSELEIENGQLLAEVHEERAKVASAQDDAAELRANLEAQVLAVPRPRRWRSVGDSAADA
jgi:hypothetical protein